MVKNKLLAGLLFSCLIFLEIHAQITSNPASFVPANSVLELYGKNIDSKKNTFNAFLISADGIELNLVSKIQSKKSSQKVFIQIPYLDVPGIFTLKTYGGDIMEDSSQDFYLFIGLPNENSELDLLTDAYTFTEDYEPGYDQFGIDLESLVEVAKGEKGDDGPAGDTGPVGETGDTGATGASSSFSGGTVSGVTTFSSLVTFTSTVNISSNAGTGKLLTSDANGLASWQTPPSGCANELDELTDAVLDGDNLFLGQDSGNNLDPSANGNTAMGSRALSANTSGMHNSALGYHALKTNTTGSYNSALGNYALEDNTQGDDNTAVGYYSLSSNTTGDKNIAIGNYALTLNQTGNRNIAMGYNSLAALTSGSDNIAIGFNALKTLTSSPSSENIVIGYKALEDLYTGERNIAIGSNTGSSALLNLNNSILIGDNADVRTSINQSYFLNIGNLIYGNTYPAYNYLGINTNTPARNLHVKDTIRLEPQSSAPSSPVIGDLYVDSDSNELCFYDGSAWVGLKAGGACV